MERIILDDIPFEADENGLMELLRIRPGTRNAADFCAILREAGAVARPRAGFGVASPVMAGDDSVEIGQVRFTGRILRVNLEKAGVVFPFVATCGTELEEWSSGLSGTLHAFWAENIMLLALGSAVARLEQHLKDRLGVQEFSTMNPGSLPEWPIEQQAPLFALLGDTVRAMGVRLTDRMVIRPLKSVSGISFVSAEGFVNCALCPRERCPSRRAAYDAALYRIRFTGT
ncbi:MAG TPA: vitamin B12 dependent methionine synthase [Deltaproteobacteria bacterium]|nr:vitamin B12 dependent methionine synthase [Deltaproteobacteria bacterium]